MVALSQVTLEETSGGPCPLRLPFLDSGTSHSTSAGSPRSPSPLLKACHSRISSHVVFFPSPTRTRLSHCPLCLFSLLWSDLNKHLCLLHAGISVLHFLVSHHAHQEPCVERVLSKGLPESVSGCHILISVMFFTP